MQSHLYQAARRAAVVARENLNRLTLGKSGDGLLRLTATAGELGTAREEVEVETTGDPAGEPRSVTLNVAYLLDALKAVETEKVALELTEPKQPVVVRPVGDDGHQTIVMPLNA